MTEEKHFHRSGLYVASFQIEGLCTALRELVIRGIETGKHSVAILKSLRDRLVETGSGFSIELIPEVDEATTSADLLTIAEVLRTTILAFLTPEEAEEQRGLFGFHAASFRTANP